MWQWACPVSNVMRQWACSVSDIIWLWAWCSVSDVMWQWACSVSDIIWLAPWPPMGVLSMVLAHCHRGNGLSTWETNILCRATQSEQKCTPWTRCSTLLVHFESKVYLKSTPMLHEKCTVRVHLLCTSAPSGQAHPALVKMAVWWRPRLSGMRQYK